MNYYALTYPNHTTLILKAPVTIDDVVSMLSTNNGLRAPSGAIYNTKTFLTLTHILEPDKRQLLVAQEIIKVLL